MSHCKATQPMQVASTYVKQRHWQAIPCLLSFSNKATSSLQYVGLRRDYLMTSSVYVFILYNRYLNASLFGRYWWREQHNLNQQRNRRPFSVGRLPAPRSDVCCLRRRYWVEAPRPVWVLSSPRSKYTAADERRISAHVQRHLTYSVSSRTAKTSLFIHSSPVLPKHRPKKSSDGVCLDLLLYLRLPQKRDDVCCHSP